MLLACEFNSKRKKEFKHQLRLVSDTTQDMARKMLQITYRTGFLQCEAVQLPTHNVVIFITDDR
jgi:hypothetical protein